LEALRPHLSGRDHRGKRGSLRWLEGMVAERGGKGGTVRNILYKDLGAPEEKLRLFEVIAELYEEAGLRPPEPPSDLAMETARRSLGRDKRRVLRRFMRGLELGEYPQLVVVGGPATGKGVLLSAVERAVPGCWMINLGGELAQHLVPLAQQLGVETEATLAQLSPTQPYALQAALQGELQRDLAEALNRHHKPLLLRAEATGQLGGLPLRDFQGNSVGLADWLEPLLRQLTIPYLVALSEPPPGLPCDWLSAPSRAEARRYVRDRLPELGSERLEHLVNQAGRNFAELSRLVLLEAAHLGSTPLGNIGDALAQDTALKPIFEALAILSPEADPAVPLALLEKALGKGHAQLSQAERALLAPLGEGKVRPTLRTLFPQVGSRETKRLHELGLSFFSDSIFRQLYHARGAGKLELLLTILSEDPARWPLLPRLWEEAQHWPRAKRERLAMVLVRYRAVLGQYAHPEALEALEVLAASPEPETRSWARVKGAEGRVDAGDYSAAIALMPAPNTLADEVRAEGLLVWAALERWQGDYVQADAYVQQALQAPSLPFLADRIRLWQGLVAKDAGRFEEALQALNRVKHDPLLESRAGYQAGDLLQRLGRVYESKERILVALEGLQTSGAPSEEVARVRARLGSVLRRTGEFAEAAQALYQAITEARDPFTQARAQSEASLLESAQQHPLEALQLAAQAERYLHEAIESAVLDMHKRPEEAFYRHRRTLHRLAVAYWVEATGQPYLPPFIGGTPAPQALRLLRDLNQELSHSAFPGDRYRGLRLDVLLLLALLLAPQEAAQLLEPHLRQHDPYYAAQMRLSYAETLGRQGLWGEVLAQLVQIEPPGTPPEPGIVVWKLGLECLALLALHQEEAAWNRLSSAAPLPPPLRVQLGRVLGQAWPSEALSKRLGSSVLLGREALGFWMEKGKR
jgi:tetratricopeptide (TPR) repeat protein